MIIDRKTLLAVILADFFVMSGAVFIMWDRLEMARVQTAGMNAPAPVKTAHDGVDVPTPGADDGVAPVIPPAKTADETIAASAPSVPATAETDPAAPARRIRFSYRNSKPRAVEIIGDFNKWQPQTMMRGKNFEWHATLPMRPGEYTYNFIVDGKVIRDPNNPRTASEGRSLLTVKPLTE